METVKFHWGKFAILSFAIIAVFVYAMLTSGDIPPPDTSDFQVARPSIPGLPDEEAILNSDQNAFVHLQHAAKVVDFPQNLKTRLEQDEADPHLVRDIVSRNEKTYELFAQAAQSQFLVTPRKQNETDEEPLAFTRKELTRLLSYKLQGERGKDEQCETTAGNILKIGKLCHTYPHSIFQWLIGYNFQVWAMAEFRELVRRSEMPESVLLDFTADLITKEQIDNSFQYAVKNDYWLFISSIDEALSPYVKSEKGDGHWLNLVMRRYSYKPNQTKTTLLNCYRDVLESREVSWAELQLTHIRRISKSNIVETGRALATGNLTGKYIVVSVCPALERVVSAKYQLEAETVITRTVVACQLYRRQYGRLPNALEDLVPELID